MEKTEPILQAKEVRKEFVYPHLSEVLKGVSMDLYPGQSIAIMGASGEGKSTLLHILGTLEELSGGDLTIAGKSVAKHPSPVLRNAHIGFIFQAFNLLEDYSTLDNVLMPALIAGEEIGKGSKAYQHGLALIEKVGLSHRLDYATRLLSGGEKQRVALARALCNNPEIILADEPSGNLDHATSEAIHSLLMHCTHDLGKALVVVTHDKELAKLCDKILHLRDGQLWEA